MNAKQPLRAATSFYPSTPMLPVRISLIMGTQQQGRIATREGSNGDYYGVIRGAVAVGTVGLILEHSFHTNTRSGTLE